jgi:uncharacterized membrane protein
MTPITRRIVYVTAYEGIAIAATTVAFAGLGHSHSAAGGAALIASTVAVIWNVVFNTLFERWEARQPGHGRSFARRVAHALGFEGGLVVFMVPALAWVLGVTLMQALVLEAGVLLFFLVYTFVFNWGFDRIFGLPGSAQGRPLQT